MQSNCLPFRHSNGSNDDGDDQVDDTRSLSRSASENNVEQNGGAQNGGLLNINNNNNDNNNNGYIEQISYLIQIFPYYFTCLDFYLCFSVSPNAILVYI